MASSLPPPSTLFLERFHSPFFIALTIATIILVIIAGYVSYRVIKGYPNKKEK